MDCVDISFQKDIIIQETYLIGEIIMWPKTSNLPKGFISCDGTSYSTTGKYNKLYGVIDYKFGGSGNNFNVPNLNVSNTDTPILIKGDHNMTNSGNKELSTNYANISGGVNQITNNILPSHNHSISYNSINTTINKTIQVSSQTGNIYTRAINTEATQHGTEKANGSNVNTTLINHVHTIEYQGESSAISVSSYNININHNVANNQLEGSQKNITPSSIKIHYIIFTGVYE